MRLDLIDEFRLDLHPYVAGEGTRLFGDVPKSYRLDLVSSTEFSNGIVGLHYLRPAADRHDEWLPLWPRALLLVRMEISTWCVCPRNGAGNEPGSPALDARIGDRSRHE